MLLYS